MLRRPSQKTDAPKQKSKVVSREASTPEPTSSAIINGAGASASALPIPRGSAYHPTNSTRLNPPNAPNGAPSASPSTSAIATTIVSSAHKSFLSSASPLIPTPSSLNRNRTGVNGSGAGSGSGSGAGAATGNSATIPVPTITSSAKPAAPHAHSAEPSADPSTRVSPVPTALSSSAAGAASGEGTGATTQPPARRRSRRLQGKQPQEHNSPPRSASSPPPLTRSTAAEHEMTLWKLGKGNSNAANSVPNSGSASSNGSDSSLKPLSSTDLKNRREMFAHLKMHIINNHQRSALHSIIAVCGIDYQNSHGDTAINIACQHGGIDIIEYLLAEMGANPAIKNYREMNALFSLLNRNKSSDATDKNTLCIDTARQYHKVLDLMFSKIDVRGTCKYETPLMVAVRNRSIEVIEIILKQLNTIERSAGAAGASAASSSSSSTTNNGAIRNINVKNNVGDSAYLIASQRGQVEIMKLLEQHGADIHVKNNNKENALLASAKYGEAAAMEYLMEKGFCVRVKDKQNRNLLTHIIYTPNVKSGLGRIKKCEYIVKLMKKGVLMYAEDANRIKDWESAANKKLLDEIWSLIGEQEARYKKEKENAIDLSAENVDEAPEASIKKESSAAAAGAGAGAAGFFADTGINPSVTLGDKEKIPELERGSATTGTQYTVGAGVVTRDIALLPTLHVPAFSRARRVYSDDESDSAQTRPPSGEHFLPASSASEALAASSTVAGAGFSPAGAPAAGSSLARTPASEATAAGAGASASKAASAYSSPAGASSSEATAVGSSPAEASASAALAAGASAALGLNGNLSSHVPLLTDFDRFKNTGLYSKYRTELESISASGSNSARAQLLEKMKKERTYMEQEKQKALKENESRRNAVLNAKRLKEARAKQEAERIERELLEEMRQIAELEEEQRRLSAQRQEIQAEENAAENYVPTVTSLLYQANTATNSSRDASSAAAGGVADNGADAPTGPVNNHKRKLDTGAAATPAGAGASAAATSSANADGTEEESDTPAREPLTKRLKT